MMLVMRLMRLNYMPRNGTTLLSALLTLLEKY